MSGWPDSNWRHLRPERSALPTALHPDSFAKVVQVSGITKQNTKFLFFIPERRLPLQKLFFIFIFTFINKNLVVWYKRCTFALAKVKMTIWRVWCHSSVGRAKDWKSLCPRFDSWWHHTKMKAEFFFRIQFFCFYTILYCLLLPTIFLIYEKFT